MNANFRRFIQTQIKSIIQEEEMGSNSLDTPETYEDVLKTFDDMEKFVKDEKTLSSNALQNAMKLASTIKDPTQKTVSNNNIKLQKERMKKLDLMNKTVADQKKNVEDSFNKKQTTQQTQSQTVSMTEIAPSVAPSNTPSVTPSNNSIPPIKKAYVVKFDTKTDRPFSVKFSERGFAVEDTRLSFETLENALSKNYSITLNNGRGLVLDALKMQKILKYKDKWY